MLFGIKISYFVKRMIQFFKTNQLYGLLKIFKRFFIIKDYLNSWVFCIILKKILRVKFLNLMS